ncbi:CinA family protein [Parasutterella muris]|jgi:competence/damage-inducible protein CinA C-terminal domain|uniref:Nicotinamide-nucleotide amidohydrolase family protein n=1 Tax=Parasutterella muris TaxID=2565572 RepID=A0A6L6YHJ2_9BURK|nr:CinA family protein [Parasutterella muris]MVX56148.1 nicotinamide-nucleotide amidohydrolase family protein [Parasutterella muris]
MTANIESLVKTLSDRISGTGEVIVTAESLTGGMISAALTSVSGSSAWFERGFVTYTNEAKHQMLDVPQGILDRFTAVSAETVTHMLIGALKHSGASVAVAVSGIAGPTGALPGKPVGTVFIGWMRRDEIAEVVRCQFDGDRAAVREQTVEKALNGLLGYFDERP